MQAEEAAYHAVWGASNYPCLEAGGRFTLSSHPCEDEASAYVIRRVRHEATDTSHLNDSSGEPLTLRQQLRGDPLRRAIPAAPRLRKGPSSMVRRQRSWSDRQARRSSPTSTVECGCSSTGTATASATTRAPAGSASRRRGPAADGAAVNLPHVGHEVVVSFLEGDPDRPLVTGRVYNGENSQGDGDAGEQDPERAASDHSGNEILMEGKSGGRGYQDQCDEGYQRHRGARLQ